MNELVVEISKAKERLDIFHFVGTKVFNCVGVEGAFIGSSVKTIFAKSSEYLMDMFSVKFFVVGIDKNVVEVDDYANI